MKTKNYTIGEGTRRFLDALSLYKEFCGAFMDALTEEYGEKQGINFYHEHNEQLESIERIIMEYLHIRFSWEIGTDKAEITL